MSSNYSKRSLQATDRKSVVLYTRAGFRQAYAVIKNTETIVLCIGYKCVAACSYKYHKNKRGQNFILIKLLATHTDHRGNGYGTICMNELKTKASEEKCKVIVASSEDVVDFYKTKLDFTDCGTKDIEIYQRCCQEFGDSVFLENDSYSM